MANESLMAVSSTSQLQLSRDVNQPLANITASFLPNEAPVEQNQMISDELMWNLNLYIVIILSGVMAVFGTVNNVVNMDIFHRLGVKDSMSVCLFALAFTDFLLSFVIVVSLIFAIWDIYYNDEGVDPISVLYAGLAWVADSLFLCSGWIMSVMSLERCVCLIFPFRVKRVFTMKRSIVAVVIFHVVTAGTYLPIYLSHWLEWTYFDHGTGLLTFNNTNGTSSSSRRLIVQFSDNRAQIEFYVEIFNVTVIPIPCLVIILGSVVLMIYGLNASSQLRQAMSAAPTKTDNDGQKRDSSMDNKTRMLVKVVIFLAIIFTVCSVPRFFATFINIINPEINEGGRERNLSILQWQFARVFSTLNASVNIFVYLKINATYRAKCHELFQFAKS